MRYFFSQAYTLLNPTIKITCVYKVFRASFIIYIFEVTPNKKRQNHWSLLVK